MRPSVRDVDLYANTMEMAGFPSRYLTPPGNIWSPSRFARGTSPPLLMGDNDMYRQPAAAAALLFLVPATPALAQDAGKPTPDTTVSGSATIISDYRFRGVSQTDKEMAVQGGLTIAHKSGVYIGTWASNLSGWGTFGGANMEMDLIAGYKLPLADNATLDVGLTWYMYPGGADKTDFAEPYVKLSGTAGSTILAAGVAYAPKQEALGPWYLTGTDAAAGVYNHPGAKDDNLYVWGDAAVGIQRTHIHDQVPISSRWA